jgi:hypothetical protein
METQKGRDELSGGTEAQDPLERAYLERYAKMIDALGLHDTCVVSVEKDGHWFVLRGTVDSHTTRTALISMVPEIDGACWVVDHLRVTDAR